MNEHDRDTFFFVTLRKARKALAAAENAVKKAQENTKGNDIERLAKLKQAETDLKNARNLARPVEEVALLIYRQETGEERCKKEQ